MNERIIYPTEDGGIAVIHPSPMCDMSITQIAEKDVPQGVPYKIIAVDEIPADRVFRNAWEANFDRPDGYGDPDAYWGSIK